MNRVAFVLLLALVSPSVLADPSADCLARLEADDAAGAVTACTAAVEADPEDARSWAIRGLAYLSTDRKAEGATDLDRALGIDPRLPLALLTRANLRTREGDTDGARADLRAILGVDKRHYDALVTLADLERKAGNEEEALDLLERAAKAQPDSTYPWIVSADIVAKQDRKRAIKFLDKAVKADKSDATPYVFRGRVYGAEGKWKDAAADYRKASGLAPDNEVITAEWVGSLKKLERPTEALAVLDEALQRKSEPGLLAERMELRRQLGDAIGAQADYLAVKKAVPKGLRDDHPATRAIDEKYAPDLSTLETRLATELGVPERACTVDGRLRWMSALMEGKGDVSAAEQSLGRALAGEYVACQERRLPPPTERFAEVRQSIATVTGAVTRLGAQLISDCAAYPDMAEVCAQRRDALAQRAAKLMPDLRTREEAASRRRLEVAAAKNQANELVGTAVRKARDAFAASAAKEYGPYADASLLRDAVDMVKAHPAPSISQRCTDPGVVSIHASDSAVETSNERSNRFFNCLKALRAELDDRQGAIDMAADHLRDARTATDAVRGYRCSVKPGNGCVPDALWQSVNAIATPAAVAQARSTATAYARLLDTDISTAHNRHNDAIAQRNAQLEQYEAGIRRQNALDTFADAFGQAMDDSNGYGGGYRRPDSSTSLPGVR